MKSIKPENDLALIIAAVHLLYVVRFYVAIRIGCVDAQQYAIEEMRGVGTTIIGIT